MSHCNSSDLNQTFILSPIDISSGDCVTIITDNIIGCTSDTAIVLTSGATIFTDSIVPEVTDTIDLGTPLKRFREINTLSGNTTYWVATNIKTDLIDLGLDSSGETRILTADTSILNDDILNGGSY